jgi:hypothetical protein
VVVVQNSGIPGKFHKYLGRILVHKSASVIMLWVSFIFRVCSIYHVFTPFTRVSVSMLRGALFLAHSSCSKYVHGAPWIDMVGQRYATHVSESREYMMRRPHHSHVAPLEFYVRVLTLPSDGSHSCNVSGWTGGILGIFLARNNQRNVIPSIMSAAIIDF